MLYNESEGDLITLNGNKVEHVDDLLYLGFWVVFSKKMDSSS